MKKRMTAYFRGTVQGVGFRYTTQRLAGRFLITGFVRNLSDGRVEVAAEGEEDSLKDFLKSIRQSQLSGYIRDVESEWGPADGAFEGFTVKY